MPMKGLSPYVLALALVAGCSRSPGTPGEHQSASPAEIKEYAAYTGDSAAGAKTFRQCMACHSSEKGVNEVGPSLHGVIGRKAGTVPGFHYSSANKNSGITWSEPELFAYLKAPQKVVPGTYMTFAGLPKPQDRANVIAYLKTQGD